MVEEIKEQNTSETKKNCGVSKRLILWLIILLVVVALTIVFAVSQEKEKMTDVWQAVFLTNGQTYFGRIAGMGDKFLTLKDVHYLQTQTVPPEKEGEEPTQQLVLAKLGEQEFYKPENTMKINWDHILFMESLESDSQVVQTIEQNK